jgi:hypothetical protein
MNFEGRNFEEDIPIDNCGQEDTAESEKTHC